MISKFNKHNLFLVTIVLLPIFLFIFSHYSLDQKVTGTSPTGFYNGEAPYYMANARQYVDYNFDNIFYGNPFSFFKVPQKVYFQFQTLFLALLLKITNFDVGIIWNIFGLICSYLLLIQMLNFFNLTGASLKFSYLLLFFYAWGGGVHSILGFFSEIFNNFNLIDSLKALEKFEVADGWWMHSVGRNFLLPNYIYYHFLVVSGILCILKKQRKALLILCFILSFSHPFVGAQFIFSVLVWQLFEHFYLNSIESKYFSIFGSVFFLSLHLFYYFIFLRFSSEHIAQEVQWHVTSDMLYENWAMHAKNFIPSYLIVFGLFFYQIRTPVLFNRFFKSYVNRFLVFFGMINFILANHEFAIKPIQPIHFTHGMVWFPFFLLGRQTIIDLLTKFRNYKFLSKVLVILFCGIFFSDNLLWLAKRGYQTHKGESQTEIKLTMEHSEVIRFVNDHVKPNMLFFVDDYNLGIHLTVYTSMRVYASHTIITPNSAHRRREQGVFLESGIIPAGVNEKEVYLIRKISMYKKQFGKKIYSNNGYEILMID